MKFFKSSLVALTVLALSACGADTEVVYDCTGLQDKDKEALTVMITRCDTVGGSSTNVNSCKESARKTMCKPTMYLIPDSYNGDTIRPADSTNSKSNNS